MLKYLLFIIPEILMCSSFQRSFNFLHPTDKQIHPKHFNWWPYNRSNTTKFSQISYSFVGMWLLNWCILTLMNLISLINWSSLKSVTGVIFSSLNGKKLIVLHRTLINLKLLPGHKFNFHIGTLPNQCIKRDWASLLAIILLFILDMNVSWSLKGLRWPLKIIVFTLNTFF